MKSRISRSPLSSVTAMTHLTKTFISIIRSSALVHSVFGINLKRWTLRLFDNLPGLPVHVVPPDLLVWKMKTTHCGGNEPLDRNNCPHACFDDGPFQDHGCGALHYRWLHSIMNVGLKWARKQVQLPVWRSLKIQSLRYPPKEIFLGSVNCMVKRPLRTAKAEALKQNSSSSDSGNCA